MSLRLILGLLPHVYMSYAFIIRLHLNTVKIKMAVKQVLKALSCRCHALKGDLFGLRKAREKRRILCLQIVVLGQLPGIFIDLIDMAGKILLRQGSGIEGIVKKIIDILYKIFVEYLILCFSACGP